MTPRKQTESTSTGTSISIGSALLAFVLVALVGGCGLGELSTDDLPGSDAGPTTDGSAEDGFGGFQDGTKPQCKTHADCNGGYCVGNACCPAKEQVCGDQCCGASDTCFANACVQPGDLCTSSADCGDDQYCEPALGPKGSSPGPPPPGKVCLQPTPSVGRCLNLPPKCAPGAPPGPNCLPACEYHPLPGNLDATVAWQWGSKAKSEPTLIDVWSTPVVGRLYDTNCDGKVDELDPPNVVFVSGDVNGGCACSAATAQTGALRMLDGATGQEIWTLRKASASSTGFAGFTAAIGDVDKDGKIEIAAMTGEGYVVLVNAEGKVERTSDKPVPDSTHKSFGWGGALALADMDGDGHAEIAYGATVYTTKGQGIQQIFSGKGGNAGTANRAISTFVDLDGAADGHLELLAGNTAYLTDGSILWQRSDLSDGYPGVGDLDGDGKPEAVLVSKGKLWVLEGATGKTELGPLTFPGVTTSDNGGPPTVADFDGDGAPEIGVALREHYFAVKPNYTTKELVVMWKATNHDLSSSVTGSTVFDFEGDGSAEVVYNDECFLWVYDGKTGKVRFATPTSSFTATEASMVADIDGDGHAEMLMVSNSASPTKWKCNIDPWNKADPKTNRPAWKPPSGGTVYRGLTLWRDKANSWVGTRTLWNQHTYHVSNICDDRDDACAPPNTYGSIPTNERHNWKVSWLNNFRQNVQDEGIFNAPDATVSLKVDCVSPPLLHGYLRNQGMAILPAGVKVGFYCQKDGTQETLLGVAVSNGALFPGQVEELFQSVKPETSCGVDNAYVARILLDPSNPTFHECRTDNNESPPTKANCLME